MSGINKYYFIEKKRRGRSLVSEAAISDVMNMFMKKCHIDYNPYEKEIVECFKEIVGKVVIMFLSDIKLKEKTLYVKISNASVRAELFMVRDAICQEINKRLKKPLINNIIIK